MLGLLSRNSSPRASVVSDATSISTATFMEDTGSEVSSHHQSNEQGERLDSHTLLLTAALGELLILVQRALERIGKLEETVEGFVSNGQSAERQQSPAPNSTSPEARLSLPSDEAVRPSARSHERVHNRPRHAPTTTPPGLRLSRGSADSNPGVRQYFRTPNVLSQGSGESDGSSPPQIDSHQTREAEIGVIDQ